SMDPNRSVRQNDLGAYASILSGAELGPLTPLKCAYQGCTATPTIEPGNRGYSPSVNRVAQAPTSGLYYRDPQTGAIGVPIDPEMSREEFIRAAREDVAMERLAQNNKLPQGSAFQNFKATRVEGAAGAVAPQPQVVINPNHRFDTRYSYASIRPASERGGFVAQGPNTPSRLNNTMDGGRLPWGSNPEIYKPLEAASQHLPPGYTVSITNSGRHDHSHNHGTFINGPDGRVARASDMVIYDPNGKPLANIQSPQNFQIYRELAQNWKYYHDQMYPDRSNLPRWGGGFTDVQADLMHLDLNAARGNGAFSWERGLSASYAQFGTPDQVGVGMGNTATYQPINQSAVGPGTTGVGVQDTRYDIVNDSGETVATGVPLPDGTVAGDGTVRLLSSKDGAPLNENGEALKDGEKPLQISSDKTLPKPTADGDGLTFKDERPTQPRTDDPWRRGGYADPYPRTGPRPTAYCVDNNGRLYGCTPTGGSNPTGGTRPGGGAPSRPTSQPQYPAQQFPRQNPTLPPYTFPPTIPVPPPTVVPPLTPSLSCSPSSVPFGTTTPVTVSWSCLTGTASSTGFATGGTAVGRATLNSSSRATSSMRFFLQCVSGARISPVATCSIPVAVPPAPAVSLTADPNPVDEGGSAVVIWGSSNASKCSLRATSSTELIDGSTDGATSTAALFMTTPVTLTCTNAAGITSSTSITIRVR
ncbi:MAG: hypothetical protein KBD06_02225, partial [Candidatus Pacebacteria bacterium]|nr:hypothetical protein [Candidatus Paceibacterota bacterium]